MTQDMEIRINTKFKIGDTVYFDRRGYILSGIVYRIGIHINEGPQGNDWVDVIYVTKKVAATVKSKDCFATPDEVKVRQDRKNAAKRDVPHEGSSVMNNGEGRNEG